MIDHVDIRVSDLNRSRAFYSAVLAQLNYVELWERLNPAGGHEIGYGKPGGSGSAFALHTPTPTPGQDTVTRGAHIAFEARTEEAVDAFHRAGVEWGAIDIGAPGPRPEYNERYYGAFSARSRRQ